MVHVSDWGLMMKYLNDWIWLRLSNRYNVTHATHALGDVYNRWVNEVTGSLGVDLVDFYLDRIPDAESLNDAEYAYWAGGPLSDAVLWLDAGSTHPSLVKVPNLGSGGNVLDAQYGDGSTVGTFPTLLEHTGENYVYFPGVSNNLMHVPDSAALSITGNIDIMLRLSLDDWTPSGSNTYSFSKRATTGNQRSWLVEHTTGGFIAFYWSVDGINEIRVQSTAALPAFTDGQVVWLRIALRTNNGVGGHNVAFWWAPDQSDEPAVWTQVGTTVVTAGTTSIFDSTARVQLSGWQDGGSNFAGKVYRAIIKNDIGGTKVLDINVPVDVIDGARTSFTCTTGQTVTVGRATAGRKTVLVDRSVWSFGTDDYLEVSDNSLLDFGVGDSFTVMMVYRDWVSSGTQAMVSKVDGPTTTFAGYALYKGTRTVYIDVLDAATQTYRSLDNTAGATGQVLVSTGIRDAAADTVNLYRWDGQPNPAADTTTATFANSVPLRIGRFSGASTSYLDAEVFAVAVWRRALTAAEVAQVVQYYNLSIGPWGGLVLGEDDLPILTESGDVINVE